MSTKCFRPRLQIRLPQRVNGAYQDRPLGGMMPHARRATAGRTSILSIKQVPYSGSLIGWRQPKPPAEDGCPTPASLPYRILLTRPRMTTSHHRGPPRCGWNFRIPKTRTSWRTPSRMDQCQRYYWGRSLRNCSQTTTYDPAAQEIPPCISVLPSPAQQPGITVKVVGTRSLWLLMFNGNWWSRLLLPPNR